MKILYITYSLSSGGAERFVVDLSNELSSTCDVVLLTLKDDTKNCEKRVSTNYSQLGSFSTWWS